MNSIAKTIIATATSVLFSCVAQAEGQTMKPLQGVSFHAGTTHASGYFLKGDDTCQLVITAADESHYVPRRFETTIEGGRSTRYQLTEGKVLEFACRVDAQEVAVTTLKTTAAN